MKLFSSLLSPLSLTYTAAMQVREHAFQWGVCSSEKLRVPVLSIGNLTVGGTGKTAFIHFLVDYFLESDLQVGIISRGYKGTYEGAQEVNLDEPLGAQIYGDEPFMLKGLHPKIPIFVGRKRVDAGQLLIDAYDVDVILADDAFQHLALKRNANIVIFDATEPLENYKVLPQGRMRESWKSLARADFVVINKCNLVSVNQLKKIQSFITEKIKNINPSIMTLNSDYKIKALKRLDDVDDLSCQIKENENIFLVSGLGRPEAFEASVLNYYKHQNIQNVNLIKHFKFSDHHIYTKDDLKLILKNKDLKINTKIICSEKDAVKIKKVTDELGSIFVTQLSVEWSGSSLKEVDPFYDKIIRLIS